jgi:hypothetical protein
MARGVHCQAIYVDPVAEMVIARFSSHPIAGNAAKDPTSLPAYEALGGHLMAERARRDAAPVVSYRPPAVYKTESAAEVRPQYLVTAFRCRRSSNTARRNDRLMQQLQHLPRELRQGMPVEHAMGSIFLQ